MPKKPTKKEEDAVVAPERESILSQSLVEEMQTSYLDYAMSVIVGRALPDIRDGLKPVHRRILYSMWQTGLRSGAKFRKCAAVVGDVLGKYHPHGDSAVYDSLVRMAQDFSMRMPLIRGQGNFGSMDGDSAAAYRYCVTADTRIVTERGLERIGELAKSEEIDVRVLSRDRNIHRASRWFDSGVHPTIEVTTNKGYHLCGSRNHPVLTWKDGGFAPPGFAWKQLEDVKEGDVLVLDRSDALWPDEPLSLESFHPRQLRIRAQRKTIPSYMTEDLAFILGSMLSEGTLSEKKLEFCNTDRSWVKAFEQAWCRVFPDCRLHRFERQPSSYGKKPYVRLEIHSSHVIEFLKNMGLEPKKSPERRIPEVIFKSSKSVVAAFARAFFEGDGTITYSARVVQLGIVSTSEALIDDFQVLLLRFGLDTFKRFDRGRAMFTLHMRGVPNYRRFKKEIGFLSRRKRAKLEAVLKTFTVASSKTDFVPFLSTSLRQFVRQTPGERLLNRYNFDRYPAMARTGEAVAEAVLAATDLDFAPAFAYLLEHQYLFEPVVNVRDANPARVYSIKVESDCHSFVGNGFINHNTEAKLETVSEELLMDIEKDTVDFMPNFDGTHKEPKVLPAKLPNLLINGTVGIAVGMASNIPPHNLREVCDAILLLIKNRDATIDDLAALVQGPDFPTGAIAYNAQDIRQAFATGKGGVVVRAKTEIVQDKHGNYAIIVSEIPYQVNKSNMLMKIAQNVRDKKIEGIRDLRDESSKGAVRIVVELKKDAYPKKVLNRLYQTSSLQETIHYNMLALVDGIQPRVLNLKMILEEYIKHRREVVRRRTQFDLTKATDRAHILEGLRIAILKIDEIIKTIKKSKDKEEARGNLMGKFKLSERQAAAILEMRLQSLANLETLKVETEYKQMLELIKELEAILKSEKKMLGVIAKEVEELRDTYGQERRTQIIKHGMKEFSIEDVVPDTQTVVMITKAGYIKRIPPDTFKTQHRGGKGVAGLTTKEDDVVEQVFTTTTHKDLLFFTTRGRVFRLKAYDVPEASRTAKGQAIVNFLQLAPGESVSASFSVDDVEQMKYLLMVTSGGTAKKVEIEQFDNIRRSGLIAIKLVDGDNLEWVRPTTGKDEVILVSRKGQSIRFQETDIRPMGRTASGVRGMKFKVGDNIVGMDVVARASAKNGDQLLVVMHEGYGKRSPLKEYKVQKRGGSGIKTANVTKKTGEIVSASVVPANDPRDLFVVSEAGQVVRSPMKSVSVLGRSTQGVRIMRFKKEGDTVASVALI